MPHERHDTEALRQIREQEQRLLAALLRERDKPLTDSERRQARCQPPPQPSPAAAA